VVGSVNPKPEFDIRRFHSLRRHSGSLDGVKAAGCTILRRVRPIHVATFIEELLQELSKPTVKQHLAALRMLFDW
jgi:hypothetical protein